ncbi:uncharacterized protein EKO05_0011052 [Ascochyta rabiei]|uniref:Uncharacterized protein n=1 Tax=Didymella rabiei TaxID=5454 RepID=A0A163LXK6_DIDRA|nr:uncharacterized protein EKO05_0011052 [Ascochyta rabiei]KZM28214.1 hypothetical protein ST47_g628 [Ascochyta rabiei]UPX20835.1 hypothetical protein EKO05_0011052 [Ascochyta rabiei]
MLDLRFTSAELRFATTTLAIIAALAPAVYFLLPAKKQDATEHVKTFKKLIKAYSTLRPEALVSTASRDFTHTVLPASLNLPSRPLNAFKGHAGMIFSLFESFEMAPQPNGNGDAVHYSKETNTVTAHCRMGGKVTAESSMGQKLIASGLTEWWTECVIFVQTSPDGKRIIEVREFVHSAKAEELQERLSGVLRD